MDYRNSLFRFRLYGGELWLICSKKKYNEMILLLVDLLHTIHIGYYLWDWLRAGQTPKFTIF